MKQVVLFKLDYLLSPQVKERASSLTQVRLVTPSLLVDRSIKCDRIKCVVKFELDFYILSNYKNGASSLTKVRQHSSFVLHLLASFDNEITSKFKLDYFPFLPFKYEW